MKTFLCLAVVFTLTSGFPIRQDVTITSLFKEWRGLIDELPVEDDLRDAAHNEVNDLFTRITADRERGLFTDIMTQGLEDDVKKEFEDSVSLFADNTQKWFMYKVIPVNKDIALNLEDKLKDSAIALKNKVEEFINDDDSEDDNDDENNNDDNSDNGDVEDSTDALTNMAESIENGTDMPDIMDMMDMTMDKMDVDMETGTDMPVNMGMMDLAMENMQMVNDFTDALMNMIIDEDMETGTDLPVNL